MIDYRLLIKILCLLRLQGNIKKNDFIISSIIYTEKYLTQAKLSELSYLDKSEVSKSLKRLKEENIIIMDLDGIITFNESNISKEKLLEYFAKSQDI